METKVTFNNSKGDKLIGIISLVKEDKNSPIILVAHGFSSSKEGSSRTVADALNNAGINTFRFDFWGHGESEGKFEDITISEGVDDILQAIKYLKSGGHTKIGLVGNSYGGICSIMAASKTDDLYVLVLRAPVSNYEEKEIMTKGEEFLKEWKEKGYRIYIGKGDKELRVNYSMFEDFKNNDGYKAAPNIEIPTLILHGTKDESVPIQQSEKISKLIPNCRLEIFEGGDHRFTNPEHFEKALNLLVDFIVENSEQA